VKLASEANIVSVIGNGYSAFVIDSWMSLNPKVFYLNGVPYGLVGIVFDPIKKLHLIASMVTSADKPFSINMLKYILEFNKHHDISWITDMPDYHQPVRRVLGKHGFEFTYENGMMYSTRLKTIKDESWES